MYNVLDYIIQEKYVSIFSNKSTRRVFKNKLKFIMVLL